MNMRPLTTEDAPALAALAAADEEALRGRPSQLSGADFVEWWGRTDLDADSRLYEEDARPVAAVWADCLDDLGVIIGFVAQGAKGRGFGGMLVDFGEARLRAREAKRAQVVTLALDTAAAELMALRGYEEVRRFFDLEIELAEPPPAPVLPAGLSLETFREEDARAFHDALDEAFQDHWEHHSVPFEKWWEQRRNAPSYDGSLWFVVRDGDEFAAVIRNEPERRGGGYVGALGVRRPWRGRGLGRALLLHTFGAFWARGQRRVVLGVDADNPTGATKLYESAGMSLELEAVVWEKTVT
jgi:ribosomal protein S18 acetylase RimI-like enzyme